jgi:hypothetical protein
MGSIVHELNSTRTAQWYDCASGTHRSDAWTERLRCFSGLSEMLAEQMSGGRQERAKAQPQIAPRALITEVARRAHFSAHETVYKRFRSGCVGPIVRWAGPDDAIKPRNALVAEAKIVSFWRYRAEVLRCADRLDLSLQEVAEAYLRALAAWARDNVPLAACRPAGPPACMAEDMQALARVWLRRYGFAGRDGSAGQDSRPTAAGPRVAAKTAQLEKLARTVVTSILDEPTATPHEALHAVRNALAWVLAEPADPVAEQLGRTAAQLHDRIADQSPGELVLTPQQASHLLAALRRLSGMLAKIAEEGLFRRPWLTGGGERTKRAMNSAENDPAAEPAADEVAALVDPAEELSRPALEGLARRYAAGRGLTWVAGSGPAWRDPGPWFLSSLDVTRAFGLARGAIGGGPDGELWYSEAAVRGPGGSRERWIVARYEADYARRTGAVACAVRRRRNSAVLGLLQEGPLPRGLVEVATGDEPFDQRYVVGAASGDSVDAGRPWAERLFTAEFTGWLLEQPYGEHGADATCFQLQGGLVCVYAAGWPGTAGELDAFCGRAARIASEVERVGREASEVGSLPLARCLSRCRLPGRRGPGARRPEPGRRMRSPRHRRRAGCRSARPSRTGRPVPAPSATGARCR